jgi:phospholipid/cholesterol/gamma-HCH transport system permease protein
VTVQAIPRRRAADDFLQPQGRLQTAVHNTGEVVHFGWQVLREVPVAIRLYPAEIFRHAGLIIRANSLVIMAMVFLFGAALGLAAHYLYNSIGIDSYIASVNAVGAMRGILQVVFGWILAAKVGCGIVAEVGAMRISEEIDAMEVMGVRSRPYLISTRVIAGAMVLPLLWLIALAVNFIAGFLFNALLLNTASEGAFIYFLFLFQNGYDLAVTTVWATVLGLLIILVASYYGYTARGGPVGVGRNTAQSMLVNLVLVSFTAMMLVQLFYGNDPNAPIGN